MDEPSFTESLDAHKRLLADGPGGFVADIEAQAEAKPRERQVQAREMLAWLRVQPISRARQLLAEGGLPEIVQEEVDATILAAAEQPAQPVLEEVAS